MHHIQRKILNQLMHAKTLSYARLRPVGVESNHFAYHLEQLMHEGLIRKDDRQYSLTDKGLALADRVSHDSMTVRVQPHIVTSIYATDTAGQLLLYEHYFQPYFGLYGPPQGRLHYAEHITEAAARELAEKTGLSDVPLTHRGIVYIHATQAGVDISKILAHIFSANIAGTPALAEPTAKGAAVWKDPAELMPSQCMPGFNEVQEFLRQANDGELFFAEIEAELPAVSQPAD